MTRTDPHSEKALNPDDYEVLEYLYTKLPPVPLTAIGLGHFQSEMDAFRKDMERVNGMLRERGAMIHGGWSTCDHCGAHYHHGALLEHRPTGQLITVGWQCADQRFSLSGIAFQRKRVERVMKAIRKRRSRFTKLRVFVEEHREQLAPLSKHRDNQFLTSLRQQLIARSSLSDKQLDAIAPAVEREAKWKAERAERDARLPAAAPVPQVDGRMEVAGEVLSAQLREGYYGDEWKWLVVDDRGFKVWGTIPSAIWDVYDGEGKNLRGRRVKFHAKVERSDKDEAFGFYKRPTQVELEAEKEAA